MTYTDTLGTLADDAGEGLAQLWDRRESGQLAMDLFIVAALAFLTRTRGRATALADVALSAELTRLWRRPVLPLGIPAAPVPPSVVTDTLASPAYATDPREAIVVTGRADTLETAQDAYADGMGRHGVKLWERMANVKACPVCIGLSRGKVPVTVPMHRHRGCGCTQKPVQ